MADSKQISYMTRQFQSWVWASACAVLTLFACSENAENEDALSQSGGASAVAGTDNPGPSSGASGVNDDPVGLTGGVIEQATGGSLTGGADNGGSEPTGGTEQTAGIEETGGIENPATDSSIPEENGEDAGIDSEPATGSFPPVTDFDQLGPYPTTTMDMVGPNSNYTVYRPTELAPDGAKNPIVVWMSGGATMPALYTLLPYLASYGFFVVASNTIPMPGQEVELGRQLIAGVDWAIEESKNSGSELFDKIDSTKVAVMGYSMGSLGTFTVADDPRLTTTVHISGGNFEPANVNNLHAPAAFICGIPDPACGDLFSTACDVAGAACETDFNNATTPVFYAVFQSGHLGVLTPPFSDRISAMTAAWLRYQLMSDATLKSMFVGSNCTFCTDPDWTVQQKNLD